jgi:hypothetical protein
MRSHMTCTLVHSRLVPYRLEDQSYLDDLVRSNYLPANDNNNSIHKILPGVRLQELRLSYLEVQYHPLVRFERL